MGLGDTVLITGGGLALYNTVSVYTEAGHLQDLPQLQHGRAYHGCSYFDNEDGKKVIRTRYIQG